MDMKKILQAVDGVKAKTEVNSSDMRKFLQVVNEADLNQPAAAPASTLSPEQLAYNQLRAQLDGADAIRGGGANTFAVVSPEVTASTNAMKQKLAQMAAALKAKGIDAAAEYDAPEPAMPAVAPVDLAKKYVDENAGMSRLLSIISEGKGPLNRSTSAEALTMQHYTEPKKTITNPVLNVQEGATPSMIGKYFKAVETELAEAATRNKDRSRQLAERVAKKVIEQDITRRVTPNADGSFPDPSINRLTGKPNPSAAEPAPSNVKPGGATVEYSGETYDVMVFGDKSIRPRIARSDKVVSAKVYTMGNKMFVLLDAPAQEGVAEESKGLYYNVNKRKKAGTSRDASHPKAPTAQAWKDAAKTAKKEDVAGPENCWPGHRKVGTKPGTGKNAGKRVNDCEKIGEATSAAQQAAIAIAKKKAGKK